MATDTLVWHGGSHYVVELDREVVAGDEVEVDRELADRLLAVDGFTYKDGSNPLAEAARPELASRKELEKQADVLGLAIYPTEDDEALASRVSAAGGDPTADGSSDVTKAQAVAEAEELGLSTGGSEKQIRARIAKEQERQAQGQAGSDSGADGGDGQ
jgi:hypothetical protein